MVQPTDNPFAIHPVPKAQRGWMLLRGFAVLLVLSCFLLVAQTTTRHWLLESWVEGWGEISSAQQIARLQQLDSLGDVTTPIVVNRLLAEDESVALAAHESLVRRQSTWAARDSNAMARAQSKLMLGLIDIVDQVPTPRLEWLSQLLNQALLECVDQDTEKMRLAYRHANELGARLANRLQPPAPPTQPGRPIVVRAPSLTPLPVSVQIADRGAPSAEPEDQAAAAEAPPALPLTTWNTRSVIDLLSSKRTAERDQATEELIRRGLTAEEIRIANQLAAPQVNVRLGLLESVRSRSDVDPRPWLLWLAEDVDRTVRSLAVDALTELDDEAVRATLRKRLVTEADVEISERIRSLVDRPRLAETSLRR